MTMQRRFLIEPHDILALDYECNKCGVHYSIRVTEFKKSQLVCPSCGAEWVRGSYHGPDMSDTVTPQFVRYLKELRAISKDSTIRLEVSPSPEEKLSSLAPVV